MINNKNKFKSKHKGLYSLPQITKNLSDNPKSALKNYLYTQSSYYVEEYFNINTE